MRVACAVVGGLLVGGIVEDGAWGKYQGAWWLASRHSRVGHVGAVVGRGETVVVTRGGGWRNEEVGRERGKAEKEEREFSGGLT